ncbi:hypothetical protein ANTPLA_LOCUS10810 [Anthophora plagiata]
MEKMKREQNLNSDKDGTKSGSKGVAQEVFLSGGLSGKLACDFSNSVMTLLGCSLARVTKLPISVALVYIRNRRSPSVKLVAARRLKTAPGASRSLIT